MAKAKTDPKTKAAAKKAGCAKHVIKFTDKGGNVIEFMGKAGKDCGPRKVSQSKAAKAHRKTFAQASLQCGKKHGYFTKAQGACVRDALREV